VSSSQTNLLTVPRILSPVRTLAPLPEDDEGQISTTKLTRRPPPAKSLDARRSPDLTALLKSIRPIEGQENYNFPVSSKLLNSEDPLLSDSVRFLLLNGELPARASPDVVRKELVKIGRICVERQWTEDSRCITDIMKKMGFAPPLPTGRQSLEPAKVNPVDRLADLEAQRDECKRRRAAALREIDEELKTSLEFVDSSYEKEAAYLDLYFQNPDTLRQFSKPGKELLDLQDQVKKLLRQKRLEEAAAFRVRINRLRKSDEDRAAHTIRDRYLSADRKLKEDFAGRRKAVIDRCNDRKLREQRNYDKELEVIEKRIAILRPYIRQEKLKKSESMASSGRSSRSARSIKIDERSLLDTLHLRPPVLLNRKNDVDILRKMTDEIGQ
jgi:hypothetical protein